MDWRAKARNQMREHILGENLGFRASAVEYLETN